MKVKPSFLTVLLFAATQFCFAQTDSTRSKNETFVFKPAPANEPLYVLKSDERTMVVDSKNNEKFDLESIDSKLVKKITVLKGEHAREIYGDRGSNGVIILQLVDNYFLSKGIYQKIQPKN